MKVTIKNTEATPVEVLKFGVILRPGESATFDIPDTDDKPEAAAPPPAPSTPDTEKPAKGSK